MSMVQSPRGGGGQPGGLARFVVAHPVWSQVLVLVAASALSFRSSGLMAVLWLGGAIGVVVWRRRLMSSPQLATSRVPQLPDTLPPGASGPLVDRRSAEQLRQAAAMLTPVDCGLPLDEQIEVAGEQYHIGDIRRLLADAGLPLTAAGITLDPAPVLLCPEPWNPADPNAVAVMIGGYHVGYLPAHIAGAYAPVLLQMAQQDQGVACVAQVWARLEGSAARARVTVLAPAVNALRGLR